MLVHMSGDRVKLAIENQNIENQRLEDENNTQGNLQPLTQQSVKQPIEAKGTEPAAAPAPTRSLTTAPIIHNKWLAAGGFQPPAAPNPTETSTKLAALVKQSAAYTRAIHENMQDNISLRQALKTRAYYDSPYLNTEQQAKLKLRAPIMGEYDRYTGNVIAGALSGIGALTGAALGRGAAGRAGAAILGGGLGFLGGKLYNRDRFNDELAGYEHNLYQ